MATRRKSSTKSKSGMISGIIIGLIIGLAVAVAAALYITKAPIPFMDKASQEVEDLLSADTPQGTDPNLGLYGESFSTDQPVFSGQEALIAKDFGKLVTPLPELKPTTKKDQTADSLDSLIAQLPNPQTNIEASSPSSVTKATPSGSKPTQVAKAQGSYYLQAGAFRSTKDAETVRARILLLGLNVSVQPGSYDGGSINRVRVGPFQGIDEMNRARAALGKEKIETSVVRP